MEWVVWITNLRKGGIPSLKPQIPGGSANLGLIQPDPEVVLCCCDYCYTLKKVFLIINQDRVETYGHWKWLIFAHNQHLRLNDHPPMVACSHSKLVCSMEYFFTWFLPECIFELLPWVLSHFRAHKLYIHTKDMLTIQTWVLYTPNMITDLRCINATIFLYPFLQPCPRFLCMPLSY